MRTRVLSGVLVVASIAVLVRASALPATGDGRLFSAVNARCGAVARKPLPYPWPVRPFDEQHPIRGGFGDPRTVFFRAVSPVQLGRRGAELPGTFSFHNGVDIVTPPATPVYPVADGVVRRVRPDEVIVASGEGDLRRSFQYWHIVPSVRVGDRVRARRTLLGRVQAEAKHVHLAEIRNGCVVDPLLPGHLTPYVDDTVPRVLTVELRDAQGRVVHPAALAGAVDIVAEAEDEPSLSVPGAWQGMPVAPARVTWRMTDLNGETVVPERVAADFRFSLPPNSDFWNVYAAGTFQNFSVLGRRYLYRHPGRYLFDLTPGFLDTRALQDGVYVLTVKVSDVRGNSSSWSEEVRIDNRGRRAAPLAADRARAGGEVRRGVETPRGAPRSARRLAT